MTPEKSIAGGVAALCNKEVGDVVIAAGRIAIAWLVLLFFKRRGIFLKV